MTHTSLVVMLLLSACGSSGNDCTMPTTGAEAKWVVNALLMPQQTPASNNFTFDLNGDMKPDNALLGLVTALSSQGLSVQAGVNDSIGLGNVIILLDETAANLDNNSCGQTAVIAGMAFGGGACTAAAPTCATGTCYVSASGSTSGCGPKYDGSETFTANAAAGNAQFHGGITTDVFTSNNPATTSSPVSFTLALPLISGAPPIPLVLQGARITYTTMGSATLAKGQINGAVKETDINNTVIPAVAKLLDARVRANPTDSTNQGILGLFDTGTGCMATDYNFNATDTDFDTSSPAMAGDGRIALCEVANNGLIKSLLKADVQLFDSNGNYAPSLANTTPDSFSIGIGFTGVTAKF